MELRNECPTLDHRGAIETPAGKIQMERSHDVNPITTLEQPKIRPDARVEIKNLIATISLVSAIVDIHYATIANGPQEGFSLLPERFIQNGHT
jgi:hypothetical protein